MRIAKDELGHRSTAEQAVGDSAYEIVNGLSQMLPLSVALMNFFYSATPAYVKETFPLAIMVTHSSYFTVAIPFVYGLVENVVGFSNYRDYIALTAENEKRVAKTLMKFKDRPVAKVALTKVNIEGRHLIIQSQEVARQAQFNARQPSTSAPLQQQRLPSNKAGATAPGSHFSVATSGAVLSRNDDVLDTAAIADTAIFTYDFSKTAEEEVTNAIVQVFDALPVYSTQRQQELLDGVEALALNAIKIAKRKIVQSTGGREQDAARVVFNDAQGKLKEIHQMLWKTNRERLVHRQDAIKTKLSVSPETQARYQEQKKVQEDVIRYLEEVYALFARGADYMDVSEHLAAVNALISSVYNVSISVVLSGLMSVGKSTVVNCLVGRNISPYRDEAMTSVPTRYVHLPEREDPRLILPFAGRLNEVLKLVRAKVKEEGLEKTKGSIRSHVLRILLDKIMADQKGLVFEREYYGDQDIMEALLNLNDIYRLCIQPEMGSDLLNELPADWNTSIDDYPTVFVRFPEVNVELGLVEFSIIDTPGIDEANAQRLNLKKVLMDALQVSTSAALITTPTNYQNTATQDLREIFSTASSRWNVSVMSIVTGADLMKAKDRAALRTNLASSLTYESRAIFERTSVFPVNARKYLFSHELHAYLKQHDAKPNNRVRDDFVTYVCNNNDSMFDDADVQGLLRGSDRAMNDSHFQNVIRSLMNTTSKMSTLVASEPAMKRVHERGEAFLLQLRANVTEQRSREASNQANQLIQELENHREALRRDLVEQADKFKADFKGQMAPILSSVVRHQMNPVSLSSFNSATLPTFEDHYAFQIGLLSHKDPAYAEIVTTTRKELTFADPYQITNAVTALEQHLNAAIINWLTISNKAIPSTMKRCAKRHADAIVESLKRLAEVYRKQLQVIVPDASTFSLDKVKIQDAQTFDVSIALQKNAQKRNGLVGGAIMGAKALVQTLVGGRTVQVIPIRSHLATLAKKTTDQWQITLEGKVDEVVSNIMEYFSHDLDEIIDKIRSAADGMFVVQGAAANNIIEKSHLADEIEAKLADTSASALLLAIKMQRATIEDVNRKEELESENKEIQAQEEKESKRKH